MASKYSRLFEKLPRGLGTDPKFQALVDAKKSEIPPDLTPVELATLYRQIKGEKDALEEKEADVNVRLAAVEQVMWGAFEGAGMTDVGFADGYKVTVEQKPSVKAVDRDAIYRWLKEQGLERLLSVHATTLQTLTLERLMENLPPPDGVSITLHPRTSLTKK